MAKLATIFQINEYVRQEHASMKAEREIAKKAKIAGQHLVGVTAVQKAKAHRRNMIEDGLMHGRLLQLGARLGLEGPK